MATGANRFAILCDLAGGAQIVALHPGRFHALFGELNTLKNMHNLT